MKKKAFTLIELSIVLIVIGLLVGGSFKIMKMMREKAKIVEAKEQVLVAKKAVIGFAMQNYYLPNSSEFNQELSPIQNSFHPLLYAADYNLTQYDICAFISTSLKIVDNGTTPVREISDIAFVVVHEGANYNMQTALNGSNEVHIYAADAKVDGDTNLVNIVENYDDIVSWMTLKQLQESVGCVNLPFRFINDKLPNAQESINYNASLHVENNVSEVTISCTPLGQDHNITFTLPNILSGTPSSFGEVIYDCTAKEDSHSNRAAAKKRFVIPIDPNYNRGKNATCSNGGDCVSGFCVGGLCTTGAFGANCIDGGDCKSGICKDSFCSGQIGSACANHAECLSGYCSSGACAIMPSGGDSNSTGGGGDNNGTIGNYAIQSISNGSYKLNQGSCIAGATTEVASGTFMEVFKYIGCDSYWIKKGATVNVLDSDGDHTVRCDNDGNCN